MRFTSLIIELIRARPRLVVWLAVLLQAGLWLIVPLLFYRSPPGDLATVLAFGREYQVGTDLGPPLAFWLADIAFRLAGNHLFGVYLLAQLCSIATFWALYQLARAIVGGQHAVLAVLLTLTVTTFSSPGVEFGPLVLARPLWALLLLHSWQLLGQRRRNAWFAWSIEAGLLLLTIPSAIGLLLLIAIFALVTERGRRTLMSFDALFALLVIVVLVLPYLVWVIRADALALPPGWATGALSAKALHWVELLGGLLLSLSGIVALTIINSGWFGRAQEEAPIIYRPPVDPLARDFVYFFAIAPALAVVMTTLFLPWTGDGEVATSLPATSVAHFFGDSFERRTNRPLPAVAGDPQLASLIALDSSRPHLFLDAVPQRTPWLTMAKFNETGGVVVWRASDTVGTPPDDIAKRFPGLVPEVPRAFERLVNGRQPLFRIGWAIVRPRSP